jgi:NAD(P)-dependent dehydrogenase (short-subunit alcohol dehydrogenase family)
MELPGTRALFTSIHLDFEPGLPDGPTVFDYEAKVESYDTRFGVLAIGVRLSMAQSTVATGLLKAMVRSRKVPPISVSSLSPSSDRLKGRLALVTGASRGLGAAVAESLVRQGCTVLANFRESSASIEELGRRLEGASGELVPTRGDAADPAWSADVRKLIDERGGLDILVVNASPALQPLSIEPAAIKRLADYVTKSFALVSVPMAYLLDSLEARRGRVVLVSSIYARTAPREWPHYVAAKCAIEGYARAAAADYPKVSFSIVRPPRLLTDFSDGPLNTDAMAPELVAVDIVEHLIEPGRPGEIRLLERFDRADARGGEPNAAPTSTGLENAT